MVFYLHRHPILFDNVSASLSVNSFWLVFATYLADRHFAWREHQNCKNFLSVRREQKKRFNKNTMVLEFGEPVSCGEYSGKAQSDMSNNNRRMFFAGIILFLDLAVFLRIFILFFGRFHFVGSIHSFEL